MEDPVCVQIVKSKTHLDKELPDLGLGQLASHLFLEEQAQISVLAEFHNDVDL